jgi:hypothetical protein
MRECLKTIDLWWTTGIEYRYQTKKEEIYKLKYIASEIYILYCLLDFTKYLLSVNTNSDIGIKDVKAMRVEIPVLPGTGTGTDIFR